MIITDFKIRCCSLQDKNFVPQMLKSSDSSGEIEFLVYTITTECGHTASSFGFAAKSAHGSALLAIKALRPLFIGQNALNREKIWQDFRKADRWWSHLPIYSYDPADIYLWILASLQANQPLYQYIGGYKNQVQVYCSSLVLPNSDAYVAEALEVKNAGFKAYKLHPPNHNIDADLAIHQAVREAVGEDFNLMSDPVAAYSLNEMVRFAQELEKLNYLWLEEPLPDEAFSALRELKSKVNIPIVGAEVLAKHPYSVAEVIATNVVDSVRADVSWSGGITGVLKTANLAEAFHRNCEIHTSIFHPLELVNLHICAAISNNSYLELLWPTDKFSFGLKQPIDIKNGIATLPEPAGLGIEFDWDFIDNHTFQLIEN